jgi:hypothetical protein
LIDTLYVPKKHRPILEKLLRDSWQYTDLSYESYDMRKRGPAYEVTLNTGKRAEPWIVAIRKLDLEVPK